MIYILGTERSASTWVANILDHHPQVDVYMEPLSSFNSRFKNWPNRFTRFDNPESKADEFKKEFEILRLHSRFLLTRLADSPNAWQTDLKWAQFLVLKKLAPNSVKDFTELNFHRKNRQISVKKQEPLQTAIKEVRLNFNASLISALNAKARVIVTIREMASCVYSMMQLIEQGHLTDLQKDFKEHYGEISPQTLCTYWLESYSVLLDSLENHQIPYEIVSHTSLLENSEAATEKIFHFLNLSMQSSVLRYLEISNQTGEGKHSMKRSSSELLEQIRRDRAYVYPLVEKEMKKIQTHPVLKKFAGDV